VLAVLFSGVLQLLFVLVISKSLTVVIVLKVDHSLFLWL